MRSSVSAESFAARSLFHLKNVERGGAPSRTRSSSADSSQPAVKLKNALSAVLPSASESKPAVLAGCGCITSSPIRDLAVDYSTNGLPCNRTHPLSKRCSHLREYLIGLRSAFAFRDDDDAITELFQQRESRFSPRVRIERMPLQ